MMAKHRLSKVWNRRSRSGHTFPFIAVFPQAEDTKGRILTAWSPGISLMKRGH